MVTECLINPDGSKMFDFPDTTEGNEAFFKLADQINAGGTGHWRDVITAVRKLNKDGDEIEEDETDELLGK